MRNLPPPHHSPQHPLFYWYPPFHHNNKPRNLGGVGVLWRTLRLSAGFVELSPLEKLAAVAAQIAFDAPMMPLQRAVDRSIEGLIAVREYGVAWRVVADALATAGALLPSGALISEKEVARLYSRAISKRRMAAVAAPATQVNAVQAAIKASAPDAGGRVAPSPQPPHRELSKGGLEPLSNQDVQSAKLRAALGAADTLKGALPPPAHQAEPAARADWDSMIYKPPTK